MSTFNPAGQAMDPPPNGPADVLDFWFLPATNPGSGKTRPQWFRKDDAFDAQIRTRFGALIGQALDGGLTQWDALGPDGALARILVLDQFTRNAFRGTPEAFAGDALALEAAQKLVGSGADQTALNPLQRWFAYMPFEHAEDAHMQQRSVALFAALAQQDPMFEEALDYARRHQEVITRFGRFPHRNAILGRASTPEELAYLALPGAGF